MKTRLIIVIASGLLAGVGATWAGREAQGPNTNGSNLQGSNLQGTQTTGAVPPQRATGLRLEAVHVVGGRLVPGKR